MKFIVVLACVLVTAGIVLITVARRQPGLPAGQAGIAYTEDAQGNLVPAETLSRTSGIAAPRREDLKQPAGSDEAWLTKFELTERSGKTISSEELKGQPYVAGFFFSVCPSICLRQNEKVQQLQEKFKGQPVRFVSITCDPEVDKPAVLAQYAEKFGADKDQWLFFTGDLKYIRRVGAEMFLQPVDQRSHTEKFVLVDAEGKNVAFYTWSDPGQWQALQADLQRLIAAGGVFPDDGAAK